MRNVIGLAVVVFVLALFISFGWRSVENTRAEKAELAWAYETAGQRSPEPFSYDRDLPADQPILFSAGLAVAVLVVGSIVVIGINTERRS
jgi:hypothetical protein